MMENFGPEFDHKSYVSLVLPTYPIINDHEKICFMYSFLFPLLTYNIPISAPFDKRGGRLIESGRLFSKISPKGGRLLERGGYWREGA